MKFGSLVDYMLLDRDQALACFSPLLKKNCPKSFGILESPTIPSNAYDGEVSHKVFVCGKSGIGKTSMISKLCGKQFCTDISETHGIQVSTCYWPVKILETNKNVLFKISFWDVGEQMLNMYHHILPSCLQDVDCVLYTFSLSHKPSWEDIPKLISRIDAEEETLKICVGTYLESKPECTVSNEMISNFEQVWKSPVLKLPLSKIHLSHNPLDQFREISVFMNNLCELLWYQDQVKAGLIQKATVDYCFTDNFEPVKVTASSPKRVQRQGVTPTKVTFC